jgi:broad specificity phosphatase PhoE
VIVIRHAEKGTLPADDPSLSDAGRARALALIEAMTGVDVGAIYSTQYRRTRETAAPLATKIGVEATVVPVTGTNSATYHSELASDILAKHRGKTVVVVGHSNTVPALVAALGGRTDITLTESQYDRMYIVVIAEERDPQTISVRYGAPTN